ncbi:MAG TPA: hypothetical protein VMS18_17000 [Candidatus Binatia bacterium]|nr:hypothetical protein [Candidatus Binatia bacterium]
MRYQYRVAIGVVMIVSLTRPFGAQSSARATWDQARARKTAVEIAETWQFPPGDFESGAKQDLQHSVFAVLPFDLPGTLRWILLVATAPPNNNCYACAPVTGAVIFALKDDVWKPVCDQPHVTDLGTFGEPPSARVRSLGPAKPAIEFEQSSMAQGYAGSSVTFVAEVNQKLRQVLSVATAESNEAADMPSDQTFSWQATVETSRSIHEGFADVIVKSSGTKPAENGAGIRPYSDTTIYRFSGQLYKKVE